MKLSGTILTLLCLGLTGVATAAKVKPISELDQLPENESEQNLWDVASKHENNLSNRATTIRDRDMERYLESISDNLLGDSLDRLNISIDFIVVEAPTLTAWVYPYGTIAVHTGLLAGMENEAQLAAVLGHELSHFLQRHSYRELIADKKQSALGKGFGIIATAVVAKETGSVNTDLIESTGGLWTNLVTSGYSRKLEYTADEQGLILMMNGNYSIDESVAAWRALADNNLYGSTDVSRLWSGHPKLDDRIKNLSKEVKKAKRKKNYQAGSVPPLAEYQDGIAPALLANARLDTGERQYARARDQLAKYISVRPDDPEGEFLLGETWRRQAPEGPDYAPRIAAYQRALEIDATFAPAWKELGMAYRQQQEAAEAQVAFENYLRYDGDAADAGIIRAYMDHLGQGASP